MYPLDLPSPTQDYSHHQDEWHTYWWKKSQIPRPTTLQCIKPVANNRKNYQPQLVIAGFLNHQEYYICSCGDPHWISFISWGGCSLAAKPKVWLDSSIQLLGETATKAPKKWVEISKFGENLPPLLFSGFFFGAPVTQLTWKKWPNLILLHPGKQTWNLKMNPWKRRFLLETIIFRFHVSFRGGSFREGIPTNKFIRLRPGRVLPFETFPSSFVEISQTKRYRAPHVHALTSVKRFQPKKNARKWVFNNMTFQMLRMAISKPQWGRKVQQ